MLATRLGGDVTSEYCRTKQQLRIEGEAKVRKVDAVRSAMQDGFKRALASKLVAGGVPEGASG